jgi:hypothetical protein
MTGKCPDVTVQVDLMNPLYLTLSPEGNNELQRRFSCLIAVHVDTARNTTSSSGKMKLWSVLAARMAKQCTPNVGRSIDRKYTQVIRNPIFYLEGEVETQIRTKIFSQDSAKRVVHSSLRRELVGQSFSKR